MERLPQNNILKFNPDTLVAVRKMHNLDKPGQMDEAIDLLDAWVKKQNHFTNKNYSREYLERVIILLKGSVERSKEQLDKICTLRTLIPHFFEKCDAKNDYKILGGLVNVALLPKLTKDHVRIMFLRLTPGKYTSKTFLYIYFYHVLLCDYLKSNDYSDGIAAVLDLRDISIMELVSQQNLVEMKQICTIFLEGYDTRVHNIFYMSTSKTIDMLIKIIKQMISEKLGKRIHIFKENEELLEYIPKGMLPSDYGGDEKSLAELHDELMVEMGSPEKIKHFKEMSQFRTNESLRLSTQNNFGQDFLGITGTFRTLSVD